MSADSEATALQRRGLLGDLARRLAMASIEELRVIDQALLHVERARHIAVVRELAELADVETVAAIDYADRRQRCVDEHGYGYARAECGRQSPRPGSITGLPSEHMEPVTLRRRTRASQLDYILTKARTGEISREVAKAMIAMIDASDEDMGDAAYDDPEIGGEGG